MTIEVLSTVLYMLNHGFYENNKELKELAMPIILMLNGATDEYNSNNEKTEPNPNSTGKKVKPNVGRYFPNKTS